MEFEDNKDRSYTMEETNKWYICRSMEYYNMSESTNKALVKSFVEEVFNKHDISAAEKYFAKENLPAGREGFKQFLKRVFYSVSWHPCKHRTHSCWKWPCSGIP